MARPDLRRADEIRKCRITADWLPQADGSALIEQGKTRVLCTASLREAEHFEIKAHCRLHPSLGGGERAEDSVRLARALGLVLRTEKLEHHAVTVDCEILSEDGGAFCAAVTGGFVALWRACAKRVPELFDRVPLSDCAAAVCTAVSGGELVADPCAAELTGCTAEVILNGRGQFLEVSVHGGVFEKEQLTKLSALARRTGMKLVREQKKVTGDI